jgi:hypothetical protein
MMLRYVSRSPLYCGHCGSKIETLQQLDARRRLLACVQDGCERQHVAFEHADELHYAVAHESV